MRDTAGILNEAYQLIEAGSLGEARNRLQPLLSSNSDNPDVWWLYAHSVEDATEGQRALQRVLELSPSYPGASELLGQTTPSPAVPAPVKPLTPLRPLTPLPPDLPPAAKPVDASTDDDFDADFGETETQETRRRSPLVLVALLLLALVVVVALLLLTGQPGSDTPTTPTIAVAQNTTPLPTTDTTQPILFPTEEVIAATQEIVMTEEMILTEEIAPTTETIAPLATEETLPVATAEIGDEIPTIESQSAATTDLAALTQALAAFNVPASSLQIQQTTLGATALVDACEIPGPTAGTLIASLMDNLAKFTGYGTDAEAIGVSVADCSSGSAARIVAVSLADAVAYTNGEIDAREFQRRWQPVDTIP